MGGGGERANVQGVRDRAVGVALSQQAENIQLAGRKSRDGLSGRDRCNGT